MNLYSLVCFLMVTALVPACESPYGSRDEMDRYTSLDRLSELQSNEIDQIIFNYINDYSYISAGLIGPDGLLLVRSYGEDRIGKTDVYASVSKPVTAMICFRLLESGAIASLDDPIGLYADKYEDVMPEKYEENPVTFKHLLAHQSGIPHHERIRENGKLKLEFEPGTGTMYSTRGYGVLGAVLCDIADMNYNQLVKKYIGEPIEAVSFSAPTLLFEAPGGLVSSTITDMALFGEGVLDHAYVSSALKYDLQWKPQTKDQIGDMGLGWYVNNFGTDSLAVYHAGSNGKPRAFIALRPQQHLGVVLLGKRNSSDGSQRFYQLALELVQKLREFEL